jgi:YidC/Oxa1 family membrane protein insertase
MSRLLSFSRFLDVPVGVAYHVVSTLSTWLAPLPGGLATATAIVAFTVAVRLLLLPLSYYAIRGERARARLLPQFQDLNRRYARDPERLRRELGKLKQAEGAGIYAGCLPLLLQLPFFSVMYRLFLSRDIHGSPNALLAHHLLGVPLASRLFGAAGPFSLQGAVFLGLFTLLGAVALCSARLARTAASHGQPGPAPANHAETGPAPAGPAPAGRGQRPAGKSATAAAGRAGALTRLAPFSTLLVAAAVPLAAGLYLLTTTAWTLLERTALRGRISIRESAAHPPR